MKMIEGYDNRVRYLLDTATFGFSTPERETIELAKKIASISDVYVIETPSLLYKNGCDGNRFLTTNIYTLENFKKRFNKALQNGHNKRRLIIEKIGHYSYVEEVFVNKISGNGVRAYFLKYDEDCIKDVDNLL